MVNGLTCIGIIGLHVNEIEIATRIEFFPSYHKFLLNLNSRNGWRVNLITILHTLGYKKRV